MNIPIRHKHAAICFAVVSLYTLICGLGCIVLPVAWHHIYPTASFMWALALVGCISCLVAVSCAWAAWALFKRTPKAGLIAMIVWLVVGALTLWSLFSLTFTGSDVGSDVIGIVIVAVLVVLELLIGIYLIERRHKAAA